jgi:hypothetical protein
LHFVEMSVLPLGLQVAGFVNGDAQAFAGGGRDQGVVLAGQRRRHASGLAYTPRQAK